MSDHQIACASKSNALSPNGHISHANSPPAWVWRASQVIASIEAETDTFYLRDPRSRKRAVVGVAREAGTAPYLRAYAGEAWMHNLLSRQQCPLACAEYIPSIRRTVSLVWVSRSRVGADEDAHWCVVLTG